MFNHADDLFPDDSYDIPDSPPPPRKPKKQSFAPIMRSPQQRPPQRHYSEQEDTDDYEGFEQESSINNVPVVEDTINFIKSISILLLVIFIVTFLSYQVPIKELTEKYIPQIKDSHMAHNAINAGVVTVGVTVFLIARRLGFC